MKQEERPPLPVTPPDYRPPLMRKEGRQEPDGRRLLLYHFDRPAAPDAAKKEPHDG